MDTFWAPVPQYYTSQYHLNYIGLHFDVALENTSAPAGPSPLGICVHQRIDPEMQQPLEAGHVDKVAVNVLAMAMIFSTPHFNALQICIDSGRFNLTEPIVFHEASYRLDNHNQLEDCGAVNFGSDSRAPLNIVQLISNGVATDNRNQAVLSFSICSIDPLFFAIAIDSLRCDENPLLTRSLLKSDVVDYSAKIGVVEIEEHNAVSRFFSNPLAFNPTRVGI